MKRQLVGFMCGALAVLATGSTAWAKTVTWTVAAGETKTFTQMAASGGEDVVAGDTIVKKGPGVLQVDSAHKIKCTVTVEEGVFHVTGLVMGTGGTVTVKKGACLYVSGGTGQMLNGWTYNVEGEGTGTDPYLGAIAVNGNNGNGQILDGTFNLTGDATFYTCTGIINNMFSSSGSTGGPTFNMNNYTVTLKGAGAPSSKFRSRWAWKIRTSGPFVVDGLVYSRHANSATTMDDYQPYIPLMKMVNGAIVSLDGYYFQKVNAFDAAAGTSFGYSSATTPVLGSAGAFNATVRKVIGCPNVLSDTVLTVGTAFSVRGGDLAAGNRLSSVNALTFGSGCTLDVTELGELDYSPGTVYTVAASQASVSGTPTLVGDAANLFTVANTGTAITITAKPNAGGVFLPGEENAAANTAALATFCANATDGMNVLLSKGDYYFTGDFDLSAMTAKDVTIQSIDNAATIHATLKLGAAENVKVSKVNFAGTDGPAVVANGTVGLTIADCKLTDVAGAWTDGKKYPYAATDVTDFELLRPAYAFTGDKHPWNGAAFFDGGTQTEKSRARAGEWVVFIDPNATDTGGAMGWAGVGYVTNVNGLAQGAYSGLKLRKTGGGTFDPGNSLASIGVSGIEIAEGQYVERGNDHLGVAGKDVTVKSGANLTIAGGGASISARTVNFEGTGLRADAPAVRFTGSSIWNKADGVTWKLTGDATMYDNVANAANGNFLNSKFHTGGHTLTLTGTSGGTYRIGRSCAWYDGGQMVVRGVRLSSTPSANNVTVASKTSFSYKDGNRPKFVFQNSGSKTAIFAPESCEIQYLVTDIDFATADCQFTPGVNNDAKNLPNALAFSFFRFAGAPVIGENLESLTIENNYTIHVAQLKAGKTLTLPATKPLTFKDGATVTLDDLTAYAKPEKVVFATASEITGKPKPDDAAVEAGWRVRKETNADGTVSLFLGPALGMMFIVR